jgi:hypothetical protein
MQGANLARIERRVYELSTRQSFRSSLGPFKGRNAAKRERGWYTTKRVMHKDASGHLLRAGLLLESLQPRC